MDRLLSEGSFCSFVVGSEVDPGIRARVRGGPRSGASDLSDLVVRAERSDSSHSMGLARISHTPK